MQKLKRGEVIDEKDFNFFIVMLLTLLSNASFTLAKAEMSKEVRGWDITCPLSEISSKRD